MQQITVPTVHSAAGLRAQAAAIRPTASDYAAHQITGTTAELEARARAARVIEVAANLSSPANRRCYLRANGIEVAA